MRRPARPRHAPGKQAAIERRVVRWRKQDAAAFGDQLGEQHRHGLAGGSLPEMRRGTGAVLRQRFRGGAMGLGELRGGLGGCIGEEGGERREGGLQILDEPERDALVVSARGAPAALFLVARSPDGFGRAGKPLADIDVAEGDAFENARILSDLRRLTAEQRERVLEQRHELGRREVA